MTRPSPNIREPRSVADAVRRIRAREPELNAFISTRLDEALAESEERAQETARSPLHNVPYSLKDTWDTAGIVTTGGSYRFRERVPDASSNVYEAFQASGAVLVGKSNCSDLALAPEASSWVGGACANPHDLSRSAGGSSGGAAAAVADGMVAFDWGSDIGGSIRVPAAFCGVYGLRLSSETWPMHREFPAPPDSLKYMNGQGPITATLSRMREVLATARDLRRSSGREFRVRGAALHVPETAVAGEWPTFARDVAPALHGVFASVGEAATLPEYGRIRNVFAALWSSHFEDLLDSDPITLREGLVAALSATFLRGRFGDRRFHPFTAQLLLLIALGRITLYRDPARARRAAQRVRDRFDALWDRGLVVVAPVSPWPAPRHGASIFNPHTLSCTIPGNVADATGLAIPFGRFPGGMPRSIQFLGPPGSEETLIDLAEAMAERGSEP